ncbi:MAG: hypothetical protein K2Q28_12795 [Hyphomicrobium sp.]|nr:hypothetical protein [Hyphomicrobium sp.]
MDDHFWPSVYPGLIVGALIGLADGSIWSTLLGALGGLGGAFVAFYAVTMLAIEPGLMPLIAIIVGAVVGAKLCTLLVGKFTGRPAAG